MEIYMLKESDLTRFDVDAICGMSFGCLDESLKAVVASDIFQDLKAHAPICSDIVTDAIAGCV